MACRNSTSYTAAPCHREVHSIEGRLDHREVKDVPDDVAYGPIHTVKLTEGGLLQRIIGASEMR